MIFSGKIGLLTSFGFGILFSFFLSSLCVTAQRASMSIGSKLADPTLQGKKKKSLIFGAEASKFNETCDETEDSELFIEEEESNALKQCELGFEGVKMILQQKKGKPDRVILDGSLKGIARPGRMLGIMGPSGSGKSTLIHALAGRIQESKKIQVFGKRYINGELLADDSTLPVAFIEQDVNFFPHMTVKETLDFRIELKLGSKLGKSDRDDVAKDLMELLGLTKSANTIVGSTKIRGISGGERKRLSIACELISSPPIIILDEPTSGLDSYQAAQVVQTLRKLADSGKTVIAVIHQPSQSVFSMFDDLLLMSEGKLMYYGEVSNVRSYFVELGYPCASDTGTAEHVLDVISRSNADNVESDERLSKVSASSRKLVENLSFSSERSQIIDSKRHYKHNHKLKIVCKNEKSPSAGIVKQFKLLLSRAFRETVRGKAAIIIKIVQQVTLGVVYGGIYKVGKDQASVMDRFGLVSLIAIGSMNMAVASTTRAFTREKAVVSSEMSGGMYRTMPYFLAKAISEIPVTAALNGLFGAIIYPLTRLQQRKFKNFLWLTTVHTLACQAVGLLIGAVSPNTDIAMSLFPPLVVLNVIFDGRNISEENTPFLFKWFPKVSLVRWAFEGLSVNEFDGLTFDTTGPRRGPLIRTGFEALERFGFEKRSTRQVVNAQRNIIAGCWTLAFLGLSLNKTKFENMVAP